MPRPNIKNIAALAGVFLLVWLGLKYLLPLLLPFLLGLALALASEPLVFFLHTRLHIPRTPAAGIGVSVGLTLLSATVVLLAALVVREVSILANALPDLEQTASLSLDAMEGFLLDLANHTPDGIRPLLNQAVSNTFSSGTAILDRAAARLPALASSVFSRVPGSALTIGTGILSAFMVSARLPALKTRIKSLPLTQRLRSYLPALQKMRSALWGWLKAQLKLSGLSFLIVAAGLLILGVSYAPLWALLIALVDAIPVLGTGTVLIPWSAVYLIQGQHIRAIGLLGIYVVAFLSRSILEPRLVGRQLGLDPLMTLVALYVGYRIWGFAGMLLSPLLCVAATELANIQS